MKKYPVAATQQYFYGCASLLMQSIQFNKLFCSLNGGNIILSTVTFVPIIKNVWYKLMLGTKSFLT